LKQLDIVQRNLDVPHYKKMPKRKQDVCRTYRIDNKKRKIKAVNETEIQRVSGATNKFIE